MSRSSSRPPSIDNVDEATRLRLGASSSAAPDALHALADDASVTVRATLAMNPSAPPLANRSLARDSDERVRVLLARKLAGVAPGPSCDAQAALQREA